MTANLSGRAALLAFLAGLCGDPVPAHAITVHGWGKADCRRFIEVRRAGGTVDQTLRQWVFGFVSAYNILVAPDGDALPGTDPAAVIALVERACSADPGLRISGAVNSILGGE